MPLNPHSRAEQADIAHRLAQFPPVAAPAPDVLAGAETTLPRDEPVKPVSPPAVAAMAAPMPAAAATPAAAEDPVEGSGPSGEHNAPPSWRRRLAALPLLGPVLQFLNALRKLASFRFETQSRLLQLEAQSQALARQTAALAERSAALERRSDALEPRAAHLEARAASLERRTDELEPRAGALETQLHSLRMHADALETHAAQLEIRTAEGRHLADAQRADTAALQAYVTALHADLEALGGLARQTAAEHQALAQSLAADAAANRPGHD